MSYDARHTEVENAISQGDVEALVDLWYSATTYKGGEKIRNLITEGIPQLAYKHQIDYEGDSFRDFVKAYDHTLLDRECGEYPEKCLVYYADLGHRKGVLRSLERGATSISSAILAAAKRGRLQLIEELLWPMFISKEVSARRLRSFYPELLRAAVQSKNTPTIKFALEEVLLFASETEYSRVDFTDLFRLAVDLYDPNFVRYLIEKYNAYDPERKLLTETSVTATARQRVKKHRSPIDVSLVEAINQGEHEIAYMLIDAGVTNYAYVLSAAEAKDDKEMIDYLLEKSR